MQRFARIFVSVLAAAAVLASGSAVMAQNADADEAFEPLDRQLTALFEAYGEGSELSDRDREVVEELRDDVRAFNEEHPDHVRGLAGELELLNILSDPSARTQSFVDITEEKLPLIERLVELMPDNPLLRLTWARHEMRAHHYDAAIEVLEGFAFDYGDWPQAALYLAECYQAEDRFDDALDVLQQIPEDEPGIDGQLQSRIDQERETAAELVDLWQAEQDLREADADADLPRLAIYTTAGRIVVELFEDQAPNTVANFITLAEENFYNETRFHRVIPNFMAQGGDPNTRPDEDGRPGAGGPEYMIPDEVDHDDARMHFTGSLAMAKSPEPDTAGSQFYFNHQPTPHLNGVHTVFGRVIEGVDVVRSLVVDDAIESVEILRKRDHDYSFTRVGDEPEDVLAPTPVPDDPGIPGDQPPDIDPPGDTPPPLPPEGGSAGDGND